MRLKKYKSSQFDDGKKPLFVRYTWLHRRLYRCTYKYSLFKWIELSEYIKLKISYSFDILTELKWSWQHIHTYTYVRTHAFICHMVETERFASFRSISTASKFTIHWHRTIPIRCVHRILFSFTLYQQFSRQFRHLCHREQTENSIVWKFHPKF